MNEHQKELSPEEAEKLASNATQTLFTWAVIFLAFIAGLVGLLPMVKPYEMTTWWWAYNTVLFIVYLVLTAGLSYSFYTLWRTSSIIVKLRPYYESTAVTDFLKKNWSVFYLRLIVTKGHNFAKWAVMFLAVIWGALWIALFFLKILA
ncbi:hypothetical protein MUP01_10150 [Candidatus Bathyarchaeota archaeon]|nr:hypothetical protein [Candidatus Bathyarchaeota archaeon]